MRLASRGVERLEDGSARLWGRVEYEGGDGGSELLWFRVPADRAASLTSSGNPWAVCLLPLAMTVGEPLRVDAPVCPGLLAGLARLQPIWRSWYPWLHPVALEAPALTAGIPGTRTGLFFSGGVDSSYSLVTRADAAPDLLLVHGADLPLQAVEAFGAMVTRGQEVAAAFGTRLVPIACNLRETRWGRTNWGHLSHGAFLVACGLALEGDYGRLILASNNNELCSPLGSHPATDPLLSTAATQVVHDEESHRITKCAALGQSEVLLRHLRVCWRSRDGRNCGTCEKCCRNMLILELLGLLERCDLFPARRTDLSRVARIYIDEPGMHGVYDRVRSLAEAQDRQDVCRALDRMERRSRTVRRAVRGAAVLSRVPVLGSLAVTIRDSLLGRSVR